MYEGRDVTVVVPGYNEEALVGQTVKRMPDFVDHILVIDDASTDRTGEVALAVGDPRVEVIRHDVNKGVGGAVLTGHQRALELDTDISVVMAADGQMDPEYLPALLDPICHDGYDFSKGNRFFSSTSFEGMPRTRIVGNILISIMTKAASGYWQIFDPLNGYTAVTSTVLRRLPMDRIRQDYSFESDLLVNLNIVGAKAIDVDIPAVYGDEVSGIRLPKASLSTVLGLVRGYWRRIIWKHVLWSFSAVALFLFTGLFFTAVGIGISIWVAIASSVQTPSPATVFIAVGPLMLGLHLLIMSVVLDVLGAQQ